MVSKIVPAIAVFVGTIAASLCAYLPLAAGGSPASADHASYDPTQSIHYAFGSKSASGYFEPQDGGCFVVLMITENREPGAQPPLSPARIRLLLSPGETAGLDSDEGRSLNLTCGDGAATLLVTAGDREMLVALQKVQHAQTAAGPQ